MVFLCTQELRCCWISNIFYRIKKRTEKLSAINTKIIEPER